MERKAQAWTLLRGDLQRVKSVKDRIPMMDAGLLWALPIRQAQVQAQILRVVRVQEWKSALREQKLVIEQVKGVSAWVSVYYEKQDEQSRRERSGKNKPTLRSEPRIA